MLPSPLGILFNLVPNAYRDDVVYLVFNFTTYSWSQFQHGFLYIAANLQRNKVCKFYFTVMLVNSRPVGKMGQNGSGSRFRSETRAVPSRWNLASSQVIGYIGKKFLK